MACQRTTSGGCLSAFRFCFKRKGKKRGREIQSPAAETLLSHSSSCAENPPAAILVGSESHNSVINPPSPAAPEAVVSTNTAPTSVCDETTKTFDPPPPEEAIKTNDCAPTADLWEQAIAASNDETQRWIAMIRTAMKAENLSAKGLIESVHRMEETHKDKSQQLTVGGRVILRADYVSRVISVLTTTGNIAMNFAPRPAPAIWSAVKYILDTGVSQSDELIALLGCLDIVLRLVRRGQIYQQVYLDTTMVPIDFEKSDHREDLRQQLIEVYKSCLEFVAFVNQQVQKSCLVRLFNTFLNPDQGEKRISDLELLEQNLESAARICEATESEEHRKLLRSLAAPLSRVDDRVNEVLRKLKKDEIKKAMEFISTIPVGSHHTEKSDNRTKDTGEWLVAHPHFLAWEDSTSSSLFWLRGHMGTGKSFLVSKVVDRYHNGRHDEGFAYFYCSNSDINRQKTEHILRSYIRQLSEVTNRVDRIHAASVELYKKKDRIQESITRNDCIDALVQITNSYPRTTLILDGLDECTSETKRELVELFGRLVHQSRRLVRVFIASRGDPDIQSHLTSLHEADTMTTVDTEGNWGDIEKFVDGEMAKHAHNWQTIASKTKEEVKEKLVADKGSGMFRWAYLQWEQIKELCTDSDITSRLSQIPPTLESAYDESYEKHHPGTVARLILQRAVRWVACAQAPLTSCQLLSAILAESRQIDGNRAIKEGDLAEANLEKICRYFLVKYEDDGYELYPWYREEFQSRRDMPHQLWKAPHASVIDYFEKKTPGWLSIAKSEVTLVLAKCLIDCCSNPPQEWPQEEAEQQWSGSKIQSWFSTTQSLATSSDNCHLIHPCHPLQQHIQLNWCAYISQLPDLSDLAKSSGHNAKAAEVARVLREFSGEHGLTQPSKAYWVFGKYITTSPSWYSLHGGFIQHSVETTEMVGRRPLPYCLYELLGKWWEQVDLSFLEGDQRVDCLFAAVELGKTELCRSLVGQGCDLDKFREKYGPDALLRSIYTRNIEMFELILEKNAQLEGTVNDFCLFCSAEQAFSDYGIARFCRPMPEKPMNPSNSCQHLNALLAAAAGGQVDQMKTLIEKGVPINPSMDYLLNRTRLRTIAGIDSFGTPLSASMASPNLEAARLLLDRGADVKIRDARAGLGNPLVVAACFGNIEGARLLIHRRVVDVRGQSSRMYGSALLAAVDYNQLEFARFLIEWGADVHAEFQGGAFGNAFTAAIFASRPSLDMVKFLVEEHGVDRELRNYWFPERESHGLPGRIEMRKRVVKYLVHQCQVPAQVMVDSGVLPEDMLSGLKAEKIVVQNVNDVDERQSWHSADICMQYRLVYY